MVNNIVTAIQAEQYCSMLLKIMNTVGNPTLLNTVKLQAHNFRLCTTLKKE